MIRNFGLLKNRNPFFPPIIVRLSYRKTGIKIKLSLKTGELNPDALKRSIEWGARAYFPKYKLPDPVPYLEGVPATDYVHGWGNLFQELRGHFD